MGKPGRYIFYVVDGGPFPDAHCKEDQTNLRRSPEYMGATAGGPKRGKNMIQKKYLASLVLAVLLIAGAGAAYTAISSSAPDGFDRVVVFMATGTYDPSVPPEEGDLAMWFHGDIMGRTDAEIETTREEAMAYFNETFGLNSTNSPEPVAYGVDPRNDYRAYYISDMDVPSEGWVVRDGGFMINLTDDTTLYGAWGEPEGKVVPAGSIFVYGDYNIDTSSPYIGSQDNDSPDNVSPDNESPDNVSPTMTPIPGEPLVIHYQSVEPAVPDMVNNGTTFRCTAIAPWGEGIIQALSYPQTISDNMTGIDLKQANIRNVQTYPAYSPP